MTRRGRIPYMPAATPEDVGCSHAPSGRFPPDADARRQEHQPKLAVADPPRATADERHPRWYCISCNYGQDALCQRTVAADGWNVCFPLTVWRRRIEPMFPSYGFVKLDLAADDWPRVCRQRGVYRLLGAVGKPKAIPDGYIEELVSRMSPRGVVDDPGDAAPVGRRPVVKLRWSDLVGLPHAERTRRLYQAMGMEAA